MLLLGSSSSDLWMRVFALLSMKRRMFIAGNALPEYFLCHHGVTQPRKVARGHLCGMLDVHVSVDGPRVTMITNNETLASLDAGAQLATMLFCASNYPQSRQHTFKSTDLYFKSTVFSTLWATYSERR